jgi:hypothetical protein
VIGVAYLFDVLLDGCETSEQLVGAGRVTTMLPDVAHLGLTVAQQHVARRNATPTHSESETCLETNLGNDMILCIYALLPPANAANDPRFVVVVVADDDVDDDDDVDTVLVDEMEGAGGGLGKTVDTTVRNE